MKVNPVVDLVLLALSDRVKLMPKFTTGPSKWIVCKQKGARLETNPGLRYHGNHGVSV